MAKNDTTLYLYELAWMLPSVALPVGMLAALLVTAFGAHIHLPGQEVTIDPAQIDTTAPFDQPGIVEVGPGRYEARIIAGIWMFTPAELRVPEGSEVTFVGTSRDVIHGLFLPGADVNVMLIPGQVTRMTARFPKVGEYPFVCHEYCGIAHHTMAGKVIVEPLK
jgi:cytochrome c oxidase subunit 2